MHDAAIEDPESEAVREALREEFGAAAGKFDARLKDEVTPERQVDVPTEKEPSGDGDVTPSKDGSGPEKLVDASLTKEVRPVGDVEVAPSKDDIVVDVSSEKETIDGKPKEGDSKALEEVDAELKETNASKMMDGEPKGNDPEASEKPDNDAEPKRDEIKATVDKAEDIAPMKEEEQ